MSFLSRGARATAHPLRRLPQHQARRNASGHGSTDMFKGESAFTVDAGAGKGTQGLGRGFYVALGSIPLFYVFYNLALGPEDNLSNRWYQAFKEGKADTDRRNVLHDSMIEQALTDRALLVSYPRETTGPELRFVEVFNQGSPLNVAAGEGTADLRKLEEFYQKRHAEMEEARVGRMKDGKVVTVYDS